MKRENSKSPDVATGGFPSSTTPGWLWLLLAVAAGLRLWVAAADELWLDEIWSLQLAVGVTHWWQVATEALSDNNHLLNTLWMHALGLQDNWVAYRLLAVVTGSGAVVLVAVCAEFGPLRRRAIAAWLMAVSYPLVQYSAEARGYAPATLMAVLAWWLVRRYWERGGGWHATGLQVALVLGMLAHLTYFYVAAGLAVWIIMEGWRRHATWPARVREWALLLGPSGVCMAVLYFGFAARLNVGGGAESGVKRATLEACGAALGGPMLGVAALPGVLIMLALVCWGIAMRWRARSTEGVFLLLALLILPVVTPWLRGGEFVYYRFFLVVFPFAYLLLAEALEKLFAAGPALRALALGLLVCVSASQLWRVTQLLRGGRGDYLAATLYMASNSPGPVFTVGSDHDFRNQTILWYYQRFVPPERTLRYHDWEQWPPGGVDWVIGHLQAAKPQFTRNGVTYVHEKSFPYYGGSSGTDWHIYRRATDAK